jgi:ubiquinone/menaquinone biosynthesis C-methylase UbiE
MVNKNSIDKDMVCVDCNEMLVLKNNYLECSNCNRKFSIINDIPVMLDINKIKIEQKFRFMEKLFLYPSIYDIKTRICDIINTRKSINLAPLLKDKVVLDIGCGPFNYNYDDKLPKKKVGIDISYPFIRNQKRYDKMNGHYYMIADINKMPYPDNYFDVTIIAFVLHHLTYDQKKILDEIKRVTKKTIIILDHVKSEMKIPQMIQGIYWRIFDGGHKYNRMNEWDELLKGYNIKKLKKTGASFFYNAIEIVLEIKDNHENK